MIGFSLHLIAAFAQPVAPNPVPVEQAPYHRLSVVTPDYAILDVVIPPGASSGFHSHPRALFYIVIEPAHISVQNRGEPLRKLQPAKVGGIGMNPVADEPRVHDVRNRDTHPYHVIGIEIRRAKPSDTPISQRGPDSRFVMVEDNPRLRAWRLTLQPGEIAPPLHYVGTGLRVYVRDGMVTIIRPGASDQPQLVTAGQFEQLVPGETRALINRGAAPIELIDVELK